MTENLALYSRIGYVEYDRRLQEQACLVTWTTSTAPDEELHRFHNQQTWELGTLLLGRRLYEGDGLLGDR